MYSDAEADDYLIDFDKIVNIPKQHAIVARCFALLTIPNERNNIGQVMLQFLQNMSGVLHPALEEKWDDWIPKFSKYLEAHLEGMYVSVSMYIYNTCRYAEIYRYVHEALDALYIHTCHDIYIYVHICMYVCVYIQVIGIKLNGRISY